MTMQEIAGKIGMSSKWYSKKEKREQDFTLREAKKLANMFDMTIDELFKEVEDAI